MKKVLACALFISFLTFQLTASNPHEDKCRQLKSFSTLSQVAQIENDLISGVWSLKSENQRFTFEFNANGMASLITEVQGEITCSDLLWSVIDHEQATILSITGVDDVTKQYRILQNCDGVVLNSLEEAKMEQWIYEKPLYPYEKQTIEMQLIGQWKSIPVSEDANSTNYLFRQNGTCLIDEAGIQTPGVWDITEDGQFIMITLQNDEGAYIDHFAMRVFDIDYHSAAFSTHAYADLTDIQYFEKR